MSVSCAREGCASQTVDKTGIGASDSSRPIYQQRWWLEIARGPSEFRESQVRKDGNVVGTLSYIQSQSVVSRVMPLSFSWGGNLHWTSLCQPDLDAALDEREKREVLQELIRKLPRKISFRFVFGPDAKDRELIKDAFRVAGFEHTTQTTYSERPARSQSNSAEKAHGDAIKLLVTTAISHAHGLGRIFDVDGVPIVNGSPDQGKNELYKKILKIPHEESRDVYIRPSRLYRSFTQLREKVRGAVKKIVARLGMYGTLAANKVPAECATGDGDEIGITSANAALDRAWR